MPTNQPAVSGWWNEQIGSNLEIYHVKICTIFEAVGEAADVFDLFLEEFKSILFEQ